MMTLPPHPNEIVLDLGGLRSIGGTLVVERTCPLTVIDVPHFVYQTGRAPSVRSERVCLPQEHHSSIMELDT